MKKSILTIILFLAIILPTQAKEKFKNPCDSLVQINACGNQSAIQICNVTLKALQAYTVGIKESFSTERIDDSTIVASGIFIMTKIPRVHKSSDYGYYNIPANSDGFISFKLYIQCKQGRIRTEFTSLNHYGCKHIHRNLCDEKDPTNEAVNGLRIQFLRRSLEIVDMIKKANSLNDW